MATRGGASSGGRRRGGSSQPFRVGRGGPSAGRAVGVRAGPPMDGVYSNEAMVHAITSLTGLLVEVKMVDGKMYEGVLRAVSPQLDIVLELAHLKSASESLPSRNKVITSLQMRWRDLVSVSPSPSGSLQHTFRDIFKTDDEISAIANGHTTARKLQRFEFEEGAPPEVLEGLEEGTSSERGAPHFAVEDMFSINKERFNVGSTYDEEMSGYTTKLDREDTEEYQMRMERARKLASEIESQDKARHGIDDVGTEEEMFSAVVRENDKPPVPQDLVSGDMSGGVSTATSDEQRMVVEEREEEETAKDDKEEEGEEGKEREKAGTTSLPVEDHKMEVDEESRGTSLPPGGGGGGGGGGGEGGDEGVELQEQTLDDKPQLEDTQKKEEAIRKFQLNPNAKEFNPQALASLPSSAAIASSSSSTPLGSSPSRSSPSLYHQPPPSRPRLFTKSPRNTRSNSAAASSGSVFTSPQEQQSHTFITPLVTHPIQSPGQLLPVQVSQYSPVATPATSLPSPTGMVVRPQGGYVPQVVGQVQQQFTQPSPLSLHPSQLQQPSAIFLQSHLQALQAPPMGASFQGRPVFYFPNHTGTAQGGAFIPAQHLAALQAGLPFPQSQGGVGK